MKKIRVYFSRVIPLLILCVFFLSTTTRAEMATIELVKNKENIKGSIIANLLKAHENPLTLYTYESNYVVYSFTDHIDKQAISNYGWAYGADKHELKFQISLGFPIWRGIFGDNSLLAASYTQRSWWQIFNSAESSPFRETNYEPQLFLGWATDYNILGWTIRDVEVGLNHQSNGRSKPTSRSWNRVYARVMAENDNWLVEVKPWLRIHERARKDDNRDISKYLGYYRLKVGYEWGQNIFSVEGNYNWNTGFGGAELGWSYPITKSLRLYTQLFSGYGESMIDYNFKQTRIGVGIILNDLF